MTPTFINFTEIRNLLSRFMKREKLSGIKKAWYFHHIDLNETQVLDTRDQLKEMVDLYEAQNILPYKTLKPSVDAIKRVGAVDVTLNVYRNDNLILQKASNTSGQFVVDNVAVAFDYLPADCEIVIAEVIFQRNVSTQSKKKKRR